MRTRSAVCMILWGVGLAAAQSSDPALEDALPGFVSGDRVIEECPDDAITGQAPSACGTNQWYFYSDFEFCSGTLCHRTRGENFPRTGLLDPNDPNQWIGTITWYGVYADGSGNGCTKPQHNFRIRFYEDDNGNVDPNNWVYEEHVTAVGTQQPQYVILCYDCLPAVCWRFDAVLAVPRQMDKGWFSIQGEGTPGCYFLWEGSDDGGDHLIYQWFEQGAPTPVAVTDKCDLNYCFGVKKIGACCDDRTSTCQENVPELACRALGGRFHRDQPCSSFGDPNDPNNPACGQGRGACCHEDGTCAITTYHDCVTLPACPGDANCDGRRDFDDIDPFVAVLSGAPPCRFENLDVNGDGAINFDDIDPFVANLGHVCPGAPICRGDINCDGVRNFDDFSDILPIILGWIQPCSFENADCNGDGSLNFDDINCIISLLGVPCPTPTTLGNLWLGPDTTCDQCPCFVDCNAPTHSEEEPCGQDTNGGCRPSDPNDPNSPPDPNAFEHLGVFEPDVPFVLCGTIWADDGRRDLDWYDFSLPERGTLSWRMETDYIPFVSTPVFGDENFAAPDCNDHALWGYWNTPPVEPCHPVTMSPPDVIPGGITYWWIVFPDNGSGIFYGYPCSLNRNRYKITITYTPLRCDPCLSTDGQENEPGCGPDYIDTFNAGCDGFGGTFYTQPPIDPNTWYCGTSGTWVDPNGNGQADHDWWKIVLTGTVKKRLRIDLRTAFDMRWELYSVPGGNCANKVRRDYYEFGACDDLVSIFTPCLDPNGTVYYMRIVPTGAVSCTEWNHYRFKYAVVTEAPACTTCSVTCSTNIDDACQSDPNGPETNAGCNGEMPPGGPYLAFTIGSNTYGPKYCGRLSTFTAASGDPAADLDWFRFTLPTGMTKVVIRGKAMFRMSINIANGCTDPNNVTHGWDRACKGATTAATQTWTGLTAATQYTCVVIYGNGGGYGVGEQPFRQFFYGLPCSDNRNSYELELKAQP